MADIECLRCGTACVRERRGPNVAHYVCPDPECQPYREPRWRFVLGLAWELFVLMPLLLAKAVWRRLRGS